MHQYGMNTNDCHICILPLFHVVALTMAIAVTHAGGKNVNNKCFDPELTLRLIEQEKGTIFFNFAPILKMILDKYDEGSYDISSLRCILGVDYPDSIRRLPKTALQAR